MKDFFKSIGRAVLPYMLILAQLFAFVSSGALFEKPLVEDGSSAALPAYEKDLFRARLLTEDFLGTYWFESVKMLTNRPHKDIESNWGYGGLLQLAYKMALLDDAYLPRCEAVVDGLRYYRREVKGQFDGYSYTRDCHKDGAVQGVAYDDNMWLARDLIGLYELTGKQQYLGLAREIADYIIRAAFVDLDPQIFRDYGWEADDSVPLGGFYWDDRHDALHVCSNGPAVQLLAALYRITGEETYLTHAVKSYNFLQYLVRPDGVFHDLMVFQKDTDNRITGIVQPAGPPYSYNSGSPITGAVELYRATGDADYLVKAKYWARSADIYFAKDTAAGVKDYPAGNVWFNAILLNGFTALAPYDTQAAVYIGHMQDSIDYAYEHSLSTGWPPFSARCLPDDWAGGWGSKDPKQQWVLDAAANATVYATLAKYFHPAG